MKLRLSAAAFAALFASVPSFTASACTLYGAAGPDAAGGGVTVTKVRDEMPSKQTVKSVVPSSGYRYTGLFTGARERFNMGVNEKGFVVFSSTAGSVPKAVRRKADRFRSPEGENAHEYLIRRCATVEEALQNGFVFSAPANFLIADRTKFAFVEVTPDGKHSVRVWTSGRAAHTNHYLFPENLKFNQRRSESSETRLARITRLMNGKAGPLALSDMTAFAKDRNAGPDDSIFRVGSAPSKPRTLSVMTVRVPEKGAPEIFFRWKPDPARPDFWEERTISAHGFFPAGKTAE